MNTHQAYCLSFRPASNSARDLFVFCVKQAIAKDLLSESYMHNQWAGHLFGYEKNNEMKIEYMSKVKREFSAYFTRGKKYAFIEKKISRDFPGLFGKTDKIDTDEGSEDATPEEIVQDVIKALDKEIDEQKNPDNIEHFKGKDLSFMRQQRKSYIYQVKLELSDGQEPHFHDGIPFALKLYRKNFLCEAVEFDYENGLLFFTSDRRIGTASYCSIVLDSSFILEGLRKRLSEIEEKGVNDELPFTKILFDETRDVKDVYHKEVPAKFKDGLDESQRRAFDASLDKDITFIWGPPGTGKSFTLASIIYALYELGEDRTAVCCLSNVAVDQLLCKVLDIIDGNRKVLRPGNIYRAGRTMDSRIISADYLFPNDEVTTELRSRIKRNLEKIQKFKDRKREMSEEAIALKAENKDLREELKERTEFLVKSSRVVFSTISNFVLSKNLYESDFDNLIVDEASMLAMPSLIALGHKISKRLIMVGDFQQLSPIAITPDRDLKDSVFEMAGIDIKNTDHPALHQLLHQRRSNEKIVNVINGTFYNNKLIATITEEENNIINSAPYEGRIIALRKVVNGAVRFTKGGTRQNKAFAESIIQLLDEFNKDKSASYSIGVITPYKGQVALIKALKHERKFSEDFEKRIKIGTIHTFQGSECDVIIYDMVDCATMESGRSSRIGKIYAATEGERLLNVAVSRARHKLIVVCDPEYLCNIPGDTITYKTRSIFDKLGRYRFA